MQKKTNNENETCRGRCSQRPKESGITLIALIITIIVMLILVAVTVKIAIDSGLFGHAGNATKQWADAQEQESKIGEDFEEQLNEYTEGGTGTGDNTEDTETGSTATPGVRVTQNAKYESDEKTATIPAEFTVSGIESEQSIDGGLVIYLIPEGTTVDWEDPDEVETAQKTYDQFVWIPVEDINDMYMCQGEDGSKSCDIEVVETEDGTKVAKCRTHTPEEPTDDPSDNPSELMAGRLYATSTGENFNPNLTNQTYKEGSGLREPDVVTSYDNNTTYLGYINSILGTNYTAGNFKQALQEEYNEVVKSVYENKGFYVGRYETSNITTTDGTAIRVVAGATPSFKINWYYTYAQQRDYANNNNLAVGSTMIQGAAYDQVMKFVNTASYDVMVATNVGHGGSSYFTTKPYQTGGRDYSTNYTGTTPYNDVSKNIFDLEGNVMAWTTEANSRNYRVHRGGSYNYSGSTSYRNSSTDIPSYNNYGNVGNLSQLYVK